MQRGRSWLSACFSQRSGEVGSRKIRAEKKPQSGRRLTERGKSTEKRKKSLSPRVNSGMLAGWVKKGGVAHRVLGKHTRYTERRIRVKVSHTSWKGGYKVKGLHY